MNNSRVLALIPARGGSKRLPGKNLRLLAGLPLVDWTLAAARDTQSIGHVVLSSDAVDLLARADVFGVEPLRRPPELADDTATSVAVTLHALEAEARAGRQWDIVVLLQPTSPLRARGRIDEGIRRLVGEGALDAVVGAAPAPVHPFHCYLPDSRGWLLPAVGRGRALTARTQDLPAAVVLTGSFYAVRTAALRGERRFMPDATGMLLCDKPGEEIDIDTIEDFRAAEALVAAGGWSTP